MTAKTFGMAGVALAMVLGTIACGPAPHNGSDAGDAGCTGSACKTDGGCVGSSCTNTVYSATYTLPSGEAAADSFQVVTNVSVDSTTGVVTSTSETVADCLNDHACGVAFADGQSDCTNTTSCTVRTTTTDQVDLQPVIADQTRLFPWQYLHPSDPPAAAVTPTSSSDIVVGSEQDPVVYLVNNAVTYHLYTAVVTLSADNTTLSQPVVALVSQDPGPFYAAEPPSVKKGAPMVGMSFILNFKAAGNASPPTDGTWKGTFTSDGSLFTGPMDYGDGTGTYTDTGVRQ